MADKKRSQWKAGEDHYGFEYPPEVGGVEVVRTSMPDRVRKRKQEAVDNAVLLKSNNLDEASLNGGYDYDEAARRRNASDAARTKYIKNPR